MLQFIKNKKEKIIIVSIIVLLFLAILASEVGENFGKQLAN